MKGHRQRLREKYLNVGYKGFQDYEILELLLTYPIKQKDCKGLAKDLLKKFKSLDKVINAEMNQLLEVDGVGKEVALYLKLLGDVMKYNSYSQVKKLDFTTIKGKSDLMEYLKSDLGFSKGEEFKVIFLNNDNKVIYDEVLFKGTIDRSVVYPRKIIELGIAHRARGAVFAHNHPSGNLTPSKKDIELTLELQELMEKVDIKLLDHIIVSEDSYYSFYENGIIEYY